MGDLLDSTIQNRCSIVSLAINHLNQVDKHHFKQQQQFGAGTKLGNQSGFADSRRLHSLVKRVRENKAVRTSSISPCADCQS
jgi:hypothetical protein